jgi:hypothetical protein
VRIEELITNINYKHLGMYLLAGVVSGLFCQLIYADHDVWKYVGPSLVLGAMIALAGRYISKITPGNPLLSPLILILACGVGWFLAFEFGVKAVVNNWPYLYIGSGIIGGTGVAVGLVVAWKLQKAWVVSAVIAFAGGLGGLVLRFLDLDDNENFPLFAVWQGIVFLGIGFAIQIDSRKLLPSVFSPKA